MGKKDWVDIVEIDAQGTKTPKWALTSYRVDGKYFIPGICITGSEQEAFFCALHDGAAMIKSPEKGNKHIYVDLDWAMREFPDCGLNPDRIKERFDETSR